MIKHVLTIAGSDSGGGAGIQADLKTFSALGTYGLSVITAVTAQNTLGVTGVETMSPQIVEQQLAAVFDDIRIDAVKIGMVANRELVQVIAHALEQYQPPIVIVDPVMVSTTGSLLLEKEDVQELKERLFPLATLVTPNVSEAAVLLNEDPKTLDLASAAETLKMFVAGEVLVKGGHRPVGNYVIDILSTGDIFEGPWIETKNTHGTGCSLSAAIAAFMARGHALIPAIRRAKEYVTAGLRHAYPIGQGAGPIHHFYAIWNKEEGAY